MSVVTYLVPVVAAVLGVVVLGEVLVAWQVLGGGVLLGGAKPALTDRGRTGRLGMALAALAGPTGNLLCAGFLGVVLAVAVRIAVEGRGDSLVDAQVAVVICPVTDLDGGG